MDSAKLRHDDVENPWNWSHSRRCSIIAVLILADLSSSWAATGFAPGADDFVEDFEAARFTATLGVCFFVLGLALGPLIFAPLSEHYGRSPTYIVSYGIFLCFILTTPLMEHLDTFFALRALSGFFASASNSMSLHPMSTTSSANSLQPILEALLLMSGHQTKLASPCLFSFGHPRLDLLPASFLAHSLPSHWGGSISSGPY